MASSKFHYADDVQKELGITNEIRVMLIGKRGAGKSATGNTLLGKDEFPSEVYGESITQKCSYKTAERFGKILMAVDTPGVFDTEKTNQEITKEIVKCIGFSSPGPHAFVLVVQIGRFTKEEQDTVQTFSDIFGEEMYKHMIILFTRRDDIDRKNMDIHQYIESKATKQLKALVQKCNGQVFAVNNVQEKVTEREKDVEKFLNLVEEITRKNGGKHYSNDMYEESEKRMRKRIEEIRLIQKMEKENEKKKMKEEIELEYQKKFREQTQESEEKIFEYKEELRKERAQKEEERERDLERKYKKREDDIRQEERRKIEEEDESVVDVQKELGITNEIRVVLIGKRGAGKSATGNTLLGKDEFPSEVYGESITQKCSYKTAERFGKILMVVDTPGVFDTEKTNEEITKEIVKCIGFSSPGPHAFVLVVQIGRFTKEEQDTVQTFSDIFGEEMYKHMIILFTRRDDIDRKNMDIHQYIESKATKQLKALVQKCNGQVFAVNNVQEKVTEREKDVEKFLNLVEEITRKNGEKHYSNDMYEELEKRMRKRIEEIKLIQKMEKEMKKRK